MRKFLLLSLLPVYCLFSCNDGEMGNSKDVNPATIFFDYRVWGDEESGEITVKLQYRFAGPNGTTLLLTAPSHVRFDGHIIPPDSSRWDGAYYEVRSPLATFNGRHEISFTDVNRKEYKEEFSFQAFSLVAEPPKQVHRGELVFELQGLAPEEHLQIILSDTSFYSRGIDRVDTVRNGRIVISKADLKDLRNGPVHLEIYKEEDKSVKNGTSEGGRLSVSYRVRREFELRD